MWYSYEALSANKRVNLSGYVEAKEIRLTNWPRTHLRGYGTSEVGVVAMLRPEKEVPQIYPFRISLHLLSLSPHDTDYATMMHGPGWQFPQRQNKMYGTTNNISIKNLSQNPLRFPRKANRFRKEGNSGLPRGKMSSSVMGDGVLNEWAGQFHNCAMSWEALTQSSDLSLQNRTKRMFHWQTTLSVLLTRAQYGRCGIDESE